MPLFAPSLSFLSLTHSVPLSPYFFFWQCPQKVFTESVTLFWGTLVWGHFYAPKKCPQKSVPQTSVTDCVNTFWGHCKKEKYGERGTECHREKREREGAQRGMGSGQYSGTFPTLACCYNLYLHSICIPHTWILVCTRIFKYFYF
jgi:hypothetical protein